MPKKKKKKFRRAEIEKRLQELRRDQTDKSLLKKESSEYSETKEAMTNERIKETEFISRDLKRVLYTALATFVALAVLIVISKNSNILNIFSEKIFWLLNIS